MPLFRAGASVTIMNTGKVSKRLRFFGALVFLVAFHCLISGVLFDYGHLHGEENFEILSTSRRHEAGTASELETGIRSTASGSTLGNVATHVTKLRVPSEESDALEPREGSTPDTSTTAIGNSDNGAASVIAPSLNLSRVRFITESSEGLLYIPAGKMMVMTMAKAGTSIILNVIYQAVAGKVWQAAECGEIHERDSPCWKGRALRMSLLPEAEQLAVLTSKEYVRIGVQRDPFERLVSAFKSIYSCEVERFNTHVASRNLIVPGLRKRLHLDDGPPCMNISEFAHMLDVARLNVGKHTYPGEMRFLDNHIRPQEFFQDEIEYDYILDVSDLSDLQKLSVISRRLPFGLDMSTEAEGELPFAVRKDRNFVTRFSSGNETVSIPDKARQSIIAFSNLSKPVELKYA